ncbi:MAG: SulP family inorganic anion transporter [Acidimicrobiia bacterium]|nr:SulP family inorganic anion transporter [Acidimicrobiia bacterium]
MKIGSLLPRASDYRLEYLGADLISGVTVAVVALPLALGFAVSTGVSPAVGVITAIVAGIIAALFGGSNFQVSGPTGAMTVVLIPIAASRGPEALPLVAIIAGLLLVAMAVAGVGRYVGFVPWPVITGFTNGIAVIIFLQQLPLVLGITPEPAESTLVVATRTVRGFVASPAGPALVLAAVAAGVMALWLRVPRLRSIPASMVALLVATGVSLLDWFDGVARVTGVPRAVPTPSLPTFSAGAVVDIARVALVVAILAALESLLSAVVADGQTIEERHDPDRELLGQGLANVAVGFFGGMPATGALARTAVNVRSGARTRLAAVFHGVVLLGILLFLAPLATKIPLAVLGGILMVVAIRMVESHAARTILRSTRSDAFVLLLTMGVTIVFDLILAVEVGMIAAGFLFVVRMSKMFSIDPEVLSGPTSGHHDTAAEVREETRLGHENILAFRIDGPVFFGAAAQFFDQVLKETTGIKVVILRMRRVPVMDATGLTALRGLVEALERQHIVVMVSGLQPQPREMLERTGVLDLISRNRDHLFETSEEAIAHAREHLQRKDHSAAG